MVSDFNLDSRVKVEVPSHEAADRRQRMLEEQIKARGVDNLRVLAAMANVPREAFIGPEDAEEAYGDHPLPIGAGQTISQPYIVAAMVQGADPQPGDRVLEVGTGTGYEAAVLAQLTTEVWTVERQPELASKAADNLSRLGYRNVHVIRGDGSLGLPKQAPFDKIVVAAAAPRVPDSLLGQLADGGRLVIPVGNRTEQQLQVIRRIGSHITVSYQDFCRFVPLVGQQGWEE